MNYQNLKLVVLFLFGIAFSFDSYSQTLGQICESPIQVQTLTFGTGDNTSGYADDYSSTDVPPFADGTAVPENTAEYLNGHDVVYAYTPDIDGSIDIDLYAFNFEYSYNEAIWVFTGCPFATTLAVEHSGFFQSVESLPVSVGTTYYIVVSSKSWSSMEYDLAISFYCNNQSANIGDSCDDGDPLTTNDEINLNCECMGTPAIPGQICELPIEVAGLPFIVSDSTNNYFDDYSSLDVPPLAPNAIVNGSVSPSTSSYMDGREVVYAYTPEVNESINITLACESSQIGLWVFTGCPFSSTLGLHTDGDDDQLSIDSLPVLAGETFYIVVSMKNFQNANYLLLIERDCPNEDGDIGDPCDDGDPLTVNDYVHSDCECFGAPVIEGQLCEMPYTQVENLSAIVDAEDQIVELYWSPIIGSTGCRIQARQLGEIEWQLIQIIEDDLASFILPGNFLQPQTDYEVRVACGCAISPQIIGPYSEVVAFNSGFVGQEVPCEFPLLQISNPQSTLSIENASVILSWDPIPQTLGCNIQYRSVDGPIIAEQIYENEPSSYSLPVSDLIPNQLYEWRVHCACSLEPIVSNGWTNWQEFIFELPECPDEANLPEGTVCNPVTGRIWMDRNLGASQVATSPTDAAAYGILYQWGRPDGSFTSVNSYPYDWSVPPNDNYWQGVDGLNNPCPQGFRVPTKGEWLQEYDTWSTIGIEGGFESMLKLPAAGRRDYSDGWNDLAGSFGYYWSSTVGNPNTSWDIELESFGSGFGSGTRRGYGESVRCIMDHGPIIFDCPTLETYIGEPCDDENPLTIDDIVNENCECVGTLLPDGRDCDSPIEVPGLPYATSDNTSIYLNDYTFGDVPPLAPNAIVTLENGESPGAFMGGEDVVYAYTPSADGLIDVSISNVSAGWAGLYVFTGCPFASTVGVHGEFGNDLKEIANLPVVAGTTYYIVISTWLAGTTDYDLAITPAVYDCPALETDFFDACDDEDPLTTTDQISLNCECEGTPVIPGQICELPIEISELPFTTSDNTSNFFDDYSSQDRPPVAPDAIITGIGADDTYLLGDDVVYEFTPDTNGYIDVTVDNAISSVGLWVFTECPFALTVGAHTGLGSNKEIKFLPVLAETTYYIVISTRGVMMSLQSTTYDLEIVESIFDCPEFDSNIGDSCDDGDPLTGYDELNANCECIGTTLIPGQICELPINVPTLPFLTSDNTENYLDDYAQVNIPPLAPGAIFTGSPLGYLSGNDVVYAYTPESDDAINVSLSNTTSSMVGLWVFTGCPFSGTVGMHTGPEGNQRIIEQLPVLAGTTYYIVISTWYTSQSTAYDLVINIADFDCPDLEADIGDSCDDGNPNTFNNVVSIDCECIDDTNSPCGVLPPNTVCNPTTGRIWMDRNLGASQVATFPADEAAYGDYYQWGREDSSFQIVTQSPFDWSVPPNDNYWQGVDGLNNPCPEGFRVPTAEEWEEEMMTWISDDLSGAFASALKLTTAGYRSYSNADLYLVGSHAYYWSTTVNNSSARYARILSSIALINNFGRRASGYSVRCIMDNSALTPALELPSVAEVNPNPVSNSFTIVLQESHTLERYELFSLDGRLIFSDKPNVTCSSCRLNLPNQVPTGLYLLRSITANGEVFQNRILVSR